KNLLLSASAYGRQRQSHDKCAGNSRYSHHDVSPAAFKRANGLLPPPALGKGRHSVLAPRSVAVGWGAILVVTEIEKRAPAARCRKFRRGSFMSPFSELLRRDTSLRLDVCRPDHLGPCFEFCRDSPGEFLWRASDRVIAEGHQTIVHFP